MKKKFKITIDVVMEEEAALFLGDRLTGMLQDTDLPELIGNDFEAMMTYADGRELFSAEEDYFDTPFPDVEDGPIDVPTLQLEVTDLLVNDADTGIIKVSKDIFDDFNKGTWVEIVFIDEQPDVVFTYQMVSEDDEGITMNLLGASVILKK